MILTNRRGPNIILQVGSDFITTFGNWNFGPLPATPDDISFVIRKYANDSIEKSVVAISKSVGLQYLLANIVPPTSYTTGSISLINPGVQDIIRVYLDNSQTNKLTAHCSYIYWLLLLQAASFDKPPEVTQYLWGRITFAGGKL